MQRHELIGARFWNHVSSGAATVVSQQMRKERSRRWLMDLCNQAFKTRVWKELTAEILFLLPKLLSVFFLA